MVKSSNKITLIQLYQPPRLGYMYPTSVFYNVPKHSKLPQETKFFKIFLS